MTPAPILLIAWLVAASPDKPPTVTCAYSHPSFSGFCRETKAIPPGGSSEEICRDILKCLNEVACTQTYCEATTIRGGWKLESITVEGEKK